MKWAEHFVRKGHEVHVISGRGQVIEGAQLHLLRSRSGIGTEIATAQKTRPLKSVAKRVLKLHGSLYARAIAMVDRYSELVRDFSWAKQCKEIVRVIQPDILHGHFLTTYGFYAAYTGYSPLVVSAWGSDMLVNPKVSWINKAYCKFAIRRAAVITAESKAMENALLTMGAIPSKVARFSWGIDCELFAPGRKSEAEALRTELGIPLGAPVILSSRNMRPIYNIHRILRSVPAVLERFPRAVFVFLKGYGLFPYEQQLRDVAKELGLKDNVHFISDLLSPEQMVVFLNASDIVISIPSSDSLPISVFEAMACDVVPIMSDIEANREVMAQGSKGFLVPIDEQQLASTVIYCLENLDSLREAVSAHNKDYVLRYQNWNRSVEDMERVYHSCLENG